MKFFSLCEAGGHFWNCFAYLRVESNVPAAETRLIKEMGVSVAVVYKLMLELYKKGYHAYPFWLNGWLSGYGFESRCNQIPCTHGWVVRKQKPVRSPWGECSCCLWNSKMQHTEFTENIGKNEMRPGEYSFERDRNKLMIWCQNKLKIYFLSITHQAKSAPSGKRNRDGTKVSKLVLANDFSKYMSKVNQKDGMLSK